MSMNRLKHFRLPSLSAASFLFLALPGSYLLLPEPTARGADESASAAIWERFEKTLQSASSYANPVQEASLTAVFTSPSGSSFKVYGFWDGGRTWRIRFAPGEEGKWTYKTSCSDAKNRGLHNQSGAFRRHAVSRGTRWRYQEATRLHRYQPHRDKPGFFSTARREGRYPEQGRITGGAGDALGDQWRGEPKDQPGRFAVGRPGRPAGALHGRTVGRQ